MVLTVANADFFYLLHDTQYIHSGKMFSQAVWFHYSVWDTGSIVCCYYLLWEKKSKLFDLKLTCEFCLTSSSPLLPKSSALDLNLSVLTEVGGRALGEAQLQARLI